jgi:hypothetical protein
MATINEKPDKVNKNKTDFSDIDQVADILEIGIQLRTVSISTEEKMLF